MTRPNHPVDPKRDLVLERVVDVPRELVWRAWTRPEDLKKWFAPAPWTTVEDMGFYQGWGQCLDQLVALAKKM